MSEQPELSDDAREMIALSEMDGLHHADKFAAQMMLAVRQKVKEARENKPFDEWTVDDIVRVCRCH